MKDPTCIKSACYIVGRCPKCVKYMMLQPKEDLVKTLFLSLMPLGITQMTCDGVEYSVDPSIDKHRSIN